MSKPRIQIDCPLAFGHCTTKVGHLRAYSGLWRATKVPLARLVHIRHLGGLSSPQTPSIVPPSAGCGVEFAGGDEAW